MIFLKNFYARKCLLCNFPECNPPLRVWYEWQLFSNFQMRPKDLSISCTFAIFPWEEHWPPFEYWKKNKLFVSPKERERDTFRLEFQDSVCLTVWRITWNAALETIRDRVTYAWSVITYDRSKDKFRAINQFHIVYHVIKTHDTLQGKHDTKWKILYKNTTLRCEHVWYTPHRVDWDSAPNISVVLSELLYFITEMTAQNFVFYIGILSFVVHKLLDLLLKHNNNIRLLINVFKRNALPHGWGQAPTHMG